MAPFSPQIKLPPVSDLRILFKEMAITDREALQQIANIANEQLGHVTPPVDPPPVDPPPVVIPGGVQKFILGPQGQATPIQMQEGVIYTAELPSPPAKGIFWMTGNGLPPSGAMVQVTMSPTPGDMEYWTTPPAQYIQWGSMQHPCGGEPTNPESPGVKWAPAIVSNDLYCVANPSASSKWYVNCRMTHASGTMMYGWTPQ